MSTFAELDAAFPGHTHFYQINGLSFSEALDRCARLTGDAAEVLNYNGMIIFAVKHHLESDGISWLNPVSGSPVDVTPSSGN